VSGYGGLSYVGRKRAKEADAMAQGLVEARWRRRKTK
jgi:hypothetical protein